MGTFKYLSIIGIRNLNPPKVHLIFTVHRILFLRVVEEEEEEEGRFQVIFVHGYPTHPITPPLLLVLLLPSAKIERIKSDSQKIRRRGRRRRKKTGTMSFVI